MHARKYMRVTVVVILATLVMSGTAGGQQAELETERRAELAAMTLTSSELPPGFELRGEAFTGIETVTEGTSVAELESAGFQGMYLSVYDAVDGSGTVSSYASIWPDGASAEAGLALLAGAGEPLDAGDGAAQLRVDDDRREATLVVDRFVVGVVVEGTEIDEDGHLELVSELEARVAQVASGEQPAGVDLGLPAATLDTRALGPEVRAGYLAGRESELLYGVSGSSLGGMQASWVTLVATGPDAGVPYVALAVSAFDSSDTAVQVLGQAAELVPLTIELQPVDGVSLDGSDAVSGFQYRSVLRGEQGEQDSFRIVAQVDSQLVVVDVQGAESVESAQAAAVALAEAQIACMAGTSCEVPSVSLDG
jgi:hypothetical protein